MLRLKVTGDYLNVVVHVPYIENAFFFNIYLLRVDMQ